MPWESRVSEGQVMRSSLLGSCVSKAAELLQETLMVSSSAAYGGQELVMHFYIAKQSGREGD